MLTLRFLGRAIASLIRDPTEASAYGGGLNRSTQHLLILPDEWIGTHGRGSRRSRGLRFGTAGGNGQCIVDIARALERRNKSGVYRVLALPHEPERAYAPG